MNYLHQVVGVCHRDIKPQNLLVSILRVVLVRVVVLFLLNLRNVNAFGRSIMLRMR